MRISVAFSAFRYNGLLALTDTPNPPPPLNQRLTAHLCNFSYEIVHGEGSKTATLIWLVRIDFRLPVYDISYLSIKLGLVMMISEWSSVAFFLHCPSAIC